MSAANPTAPVAAPRARRPQRRLLIGLAGALGCILIGACATVLVAWACVIWCPVPPRGKDLQGGAWPCAVPEVWPKTFDRLIVSQNAGWRIEDYSVEPQGKYVLVVHQWGWPLRGMELRQWRWSFAALGPDPSKPLDGNKPNRIKIPDGPRDIYLLLPKWCGTPPGMVKGQWQVPLRPLALAFAADTAFYAAAVWLATAGVALLRRSRRRRRGECPWCGYDVRGLADSTSCPECGGL